MPDPTKPLPLPPPSDPWAGHAPASAVPHPQVILVQIPRKRRWPWVLAALTALSLLCCGASPKLTDVTDFAPGPPGGQLKCANGKDDQGKQVIYCAWIDHGSMGIGVFYGGRSMSDSAQFLAQLRRLIIQRP